MTKIWIRSIVLMALMAVVLAGCKKDDNNDQGLIVDSYYKEMQTLTIEVAYEPNAEPFTKNLAGDDMWTITETNVEDLYANRPMPMDVIVPYELSAMTAIPDQTTDSYSADDIRDLAAEYRVSEGTATDGNILVLFLDGYFFQDSVRTNVLGVSLNGTSITAIFKPVINASHPLLNRKVLVEQTTVVHEIGHAVGLVNNGVPLASSHHDDEHGAHCTNTDCVMYYANEGPTNLVSFIQQYSTTGTIQLFGPECIQDTESYFP